MTRLTVYCPGGEEPGLTGGDPVTTSPPPDDGSENERVPAGQSGFHLPAVMKGGGWITLQSKHSPDDSGDGQELLIFNVLGRRVRGFHLVAQGPRRVWWDGRDEHGRKLPSGLYLVRHVHGAKTATGRVLLIR